MPPINITPDDLERRFAYHQPRTDDVRGAHEKVRESARSLADTIVALCPAGRETSLAVTSCEEAMMWANAAIARWS